MQFNQSTNASVASLPARMGLVNGEVEAEETEHTGYNDHQDEEYQATEQLVARSKFQNYLRAAYPFQPASAPSPNTITLPLNAGDIILIHSVHTNGWADGTLLETGDRGWLPTNYCEAYDYAAMRPLLRALTEFWDIVRSGSDSNLGIFQNQDYMRGLVAGVRFLLEKSDCLTRESRYVKKHDGIRRTRKCLLSDLSLLVKAAKKLQLTISSPTTHAELDECLDNMLMNAFKVVTRSVKFFDVWAEEVTIPTTARNEQIIDQEFDESSDAAKAIENNRDNHRDTGSTSKYSTVSAAANVSLRTSPVDSMSAGVTSPDQNAPIPRKTRKMSVTHRMSHIGPRSHGSDPNLASTKLNQTYDAFLGVLASFLGSHMQSRSSSELLLTTQQAVKSCRQLLSVVEAVMEHDPAVSEALRAYKDDLCDAITELVSAAKQVFRPLQSSEDDMVYLPENGRRLVQAATDCVSGAGRCVARTKNMLEDHGDFEISNVSEGLNGALDENGMIVSTDPVHAQSGLLISGVLTSLDLDNLNDFKPTSLRDIPEDVLSPPQLSNPGDSPSTIRTSIPLTPANDEISAMVRSSSPSAAVRSPTEARPGSDEYDMHLANLRHKSVSRAIVQSTSSDTTFGSAGTHSDPSDMSTASTRATSYTETNRNLQAAPSQESLSNHLSSGDVEDGEAVISERTFAHELLFNREGQVTGGTLNALIERLTGHNSTPDALFVSAVFLTFRLFAKPQEFSAALTYRFQYAGESERIANPVRLRVYNIFKGWLESHWRHDCDDIALPSIVAFAREELNPVLPIAGKRLLELADVVGSTHAPAVPRVLSTIGKTNTSIAAYINPDTPLPTPVISKSQLIALKNWKNGGPSIGILDFDALELARQITLKTSRIFCSILPEELLATEWTKQSSSLAVNVRAMSTLSTDLSNLVADSVLQLEEPKKRAVTIKQWIKIALKCQDLHNYDTIWAIVASLDSVNIKRMRKTWDLVPEKSKSALDELKKVADVTRNYSALRQRIQAQVPPCIPFLGVYLTDLTFVDGGNPATRPLTLHSKTIQVINLDKHMKTAKIISDLQRFQIPYRFTEISELQTWMQDQLIRVRSAGEKNFQNHYRRSLILEPRETQRASPVPGSGRDKDKFDFLSWTHLTKEKQAPVSNSSI